MFKYSQLFPLILAILTCTCLIILLYGFIHFLNFFPLGKKIIPRLNPLDIIAGFTIYVKTAIDFAIFIGNLMHKYPGTKNRIAIEIGTALGNGLGTFLILAIWTFFKEVPILMALMIFLSSLVLLKMAEESLNESQISNDLYQPLKTINSFFSPLTSLIILRFNTKPHLSSFWPLFVFAITVPFILGLDDFAGYIPLFSILNVFGFASGVIIGHMFLNLFLFASPTITIKMVRNSSVMIFGAMAFIGIGLWGFYEILRIFL